MIQRIQSLFFLLAAGASLGLFATPLASTEEAVSSSSLFDDRFFSIQDHVGLMVAFGLGALLSVVSIFLFKNRRLQMRLALFAVLTFIIGMIWGVVFFLQRGQEDMGSAVPKISLGIVFPVLALIFLLLAYRYIRKDEKLVRSMDRLR